jgi:hypothetical protein
MIPLAMRSSATRRLSMRRVLSSRLRVAFMLAIRHFPQRLLGIFLRAILPGHHLNQDYKDVVKL